LRRLYRLHQLGVALASLCPQSGLVAVAPVSGNVILVDDVVKGFAVYFAVGSIAQGFKDEEVMKY
jgi:hypothetical protein